jgi:hypothetical protein
MEVAIIFTSMMVVLLCAIVPSLSSSCYYCYTCPITLGCPSSSYYYVANVTWDAIRAKPHINKWKKTHLPKSDGGNCYCCKHDGGVFACDKALPLFMPSLLHNWYYTYTPSSSSCYYVVATTQVVGMLQPQTNKWNPPPPPQTMEATIVVTSVMTMFLHAKHPPPPLLVAATTTYPPPPPFTTALLLHKLWWWQTSHQ